MKLFILDFDGTIADTQGLIVRTMMQTIEMLGLESRSTDECARMIGLPLKQTFTELIPMSDSMGEKCAETYTRLFHANNTADAVTLFPNVVETIRELHSRGCKVTIASSRSKPSLMEFIERFGLGALIAYVVSADDVVNAKPHPEPVLATLDYLGMDACDAVVVGDTSFDILMGKRAGCMTCGVSYGNGSVESLLDAGADIIINDFKALAELGA